MTGEQERDEGERSRERRARFLLDLLELEVGGTREEPAAALGPALLSLGSRRTAD